MGDDIIEICAKIADDYAAACQRGGPASSMAEDFHGAAAAVEIAKQIRALKGENDG